MKHPCGQNALKIFLCGLGIALIAAVVVLSSVPPVSRDALTHHLAIPKLYLKHGGMYEIPSLVFSYYPMNLDLLYMVSLFLGNDIIPKFIHFAFALLTAWLIYGYLKKRTNQVYALAGVLFFLSIPVIVKLSITAYVDLGLVFFSTAALTYFFKWLEKSFKLKYLIISALWCGFALGTKYNGLILLFLLTLFVPFGYLRVTQAVAATNHLSNANMGNASKTTILALWYATAFMLITMAIFSPWAIRNYIWTSNPIYPLYDKWFRHAAAGHRRQATEDLDHHTYHFSGRTRGAINPFVVRKIIYQESGWQIATVPIRIFFQGRDDTPKYFDGKLNPYLLFLPLFAFIFNRKENTFVKREQKFLIVFAVLFLLLAFFQRDLRIRYIAPIIPPLVILSIFGLKNILCAINIKWSGYVPKVGTGAVIAGVSLLVCLNAVYIRQQFQRIEPFSYLSGKVGREAYIEKKRPEFAAIQFANATLAEEAKIFCLFLGNRSYYSEREMVFGDYYFEEFVKTADSAQSIVAEFKKRGITHVLVKYDIFKSWSRQQFNVRQKQNIGALFRAHAELIFTRGGYGLYRL